MMPFSTMDPISWKFTGQPYDLNSVLTPDQVWAKLDVPAEEVRQSLITLVNALNDQSASSSVGFTPNASVGDANTVQTAFDSLVTLLHGTGGAAWLNSVGVTGLTGDNVQTLLESLKEYIDSLDTANNQALANHKLPTTNDHDGRYYTENEVDGFAVKKTGDQTIAGVKTFSSSPIVPTPTTDMQASTKKYVDDNFTTKNDITNNRKLSATGDFRGTLNGYPIVQADPGYSSMVAGINDTLNAHLAESAYKSDDTKNLKSQLSSMPNFFRRVVEYRDDLATSINIIGMGSSVGVGATLPDVTTQAPSAYFKSRLSNAFSRLGNINFQHYNRSENGTIIIQGISKYDAIKAEPLTPHVVMLSYGMNDGASDNYHGGQTYGLVYKNLKDLVMKIKKDGYDVVLNTTPHPHTERMTWTMSGGVSVLYPASGVMVPDGTLAQSIKTISVEDIGTVPVSYRHYRVNEAIRRVAYELGCPLLDVERYWFKAVAKYGENELFDVGQLNHPNLKGHQESYWKAIDDFVDGLYSSYLQSSPGNNFNGFIGINTPTPTASLDVKNVNSTDTAVKIESSTGTAIMTVDNDGNQVLSGKATIKELDFATAFKARSIKVFNRGSSSPLTITLADGEAILLMIEATHSFVSTNRHALVYLCLGNVNAASVSKISEISGTYSLMSVTTSGMDIVITPAHADSVTLKYSYFSIS